MSRITEVETRTYYEDGSGPKFRVVAGVPNVDGEPSIVVEVGPSHLSVDDANLLADMLTEAGNHICNCLEAGEGDGPVSASQ